MDMGITNNSNLGPISPIQNTGKVNKTGGTGNELVFHSSPEVHETLKKGRGEVNGGPIEDSIDGLKKDLKDGSRIDLPNTHNRNSLILGQLVQPKAVIAGAKKAVEDAYQNAEEKPSLADLMIAMVGQTVLKSKPDITRE